MTQTYEKTQTSSISFITFAACSKKEEKNVDFFFLFSSTKMKHAAATFSLNEKIKQCRTR